MQRCGQSGPVVKGIALARPTVPGSRGRLKEIASQFPAGQLALAWYLNHQQTGRFCSSRVLATTLPPDQSSTLHDSRCAVRRLKRLDSVANAQNPLWRAVCTACTLRRAHMKRIKFLMAGVATLVAVAAFMAPASDESAAIFVTKIPSGYRD